MTQLQILGYLDYFALSEPLDTDDIDILDGADFKTLTFTEPGSATTNGCAVGGVSGLTSGLKVFDIASDVKSFNDNTTFDEVDRTSVNSRVKKYRRGRADWELTAEMFESYGSGTNTGTLYSGDLISAQVNEDDVRLLYVQRTAGTRKLWAIVSIVEAGNTNSEDGDLIKSVKFRVASGAKVPYWA